MDVTPPQSYRLGDVSRGYAWLGHRRLFTEVSSLHPEYRRGDLLWNKAHDAWPRTHYVTSYAQLERLVRSDAASRLVCYGLNPRPRMLTTEDGRLRSAKEEDITASQSLVIDIDLEGPVTPARTTDLLAFLGTADQYFRELGMNRPVRAKTGRGSHLLFAYEPISVAIVPDVRERLRQYKNDFVTAHRHDLRRLEARVDSTQDLRRMVRVYGTSKPGVGIISRFYGGRRNPDENLREYLLGMRITPTTGPGAAKGVQVSLPALLLQDATFNGLWHGTGKPAGTDQSNSGYDYAIASYLARMGKTIDEIAMILSQRPMGQKERDAKGPSYLTRTATNASNNTRTKP
jgi:hypothetical protein